MDEISFELEDADADSEPKNKPPPDFDDEVSDDDGAPAPSASTQDDDFDDVWQEVEHPDRPKRMRLKPSKKQKKADNLRVAKASASPAQSPEPSPSSSPDSTPEDTPDEAVGVVIKTGLSNIEGAEDLGLDKVVLDDYATVQDTPSPSPAPASPEPDVPTSPDAPSVEVVPAPGEDEWAAVTATREQQLQEQSARGGEVSRFKKIHYVDALRELTSELSMDGIKIHDFRKIGFFTKISYFFSKPKLKNTKLASERDNVFALAKKQIDDDSVLHDRILLTLYMRISGDNTAPPRRGSHWDLIGFQGTDPKTDLRGSGLLGPLQMLYFLKTYEGLLHKIFQLSRDDHQNFPLMVVSINITGLILLVLREAKIYGLIKKSKSTWDVVNELYVAIFHEFYLQWSGGGKTIRDFDAVKTGLSDLARKGPGKLLAKFKSHMLKQSVSGGEKLEYQENL